MLHFSFPARDFKRIRLAETAAIRAPNGRKFIQYMKRDPPVAACKIGKMHLYVRPTAVHTKEEEAFRLAGLEI